MLDDQDRARINAKMERLAIAFPALRGKPGISPWNADALDAWATSGGASHGEKVTARFLLAVWNPGHPWNAGGFDLMDALGIWDNPQRAAFLEWAKDPWWP